MPQEPHSLASPTDLPPAPKLINNFPDAQLFLIVALTPYILGTFWGGSNPDDPPSSLPMSISAIPRLGSVCMVACPFRCGHLLRWAVTALLEMLSPKYSQPHLLQLVSEAILGTSVR